MNDDQNIHEYASPFLEEEEKDRQRRLQRQKKENARQERKSRILKALLKAAPLYVSLLILLAGVLEFIEYRFGFCLWTHIPKELSFPAILLTLFSNLIDPLLKSIVSYLKDISAFRSVRQILTLWLKKNRKYTTLFGIGLLFACFAAFSLAVPAYAAKQQWCSRAFHWIITPRDKDTGGTSSPSSPDDGKKSPEPDPSKGEDTPSDDSGKTGDDVNGSLSKLIDPEALLLNTEGPENLTEDENNEIFFLAGPYQIQNWDAESVKAVIHKFVQDKLAIQSPPNYSMTGIPQPVRDSIAKASAMESSATTASELEEIIHIRVNAYGKKEERKVEKNTHYLLAKLVRENYGVFGDAYRLQNASKEAALTLYGRSVIWGFKTLNYDVPAEDYYNNLKIIAERYEKISMVVPADDCRFFYSGQLRDAFEAEAEQFLMAHG